MVGGIGAICTVVVATGVAHGRVDNAWRVFRGNAALTGTANIELPAAPEPRWVFSAEDSIESSAAIADGRVFVGSLDGRLYALDLDSGAELWRFETGSEVRSSPSIFGNTVYFGDESGTFYALDVESGSEQWSYQTGGGIVSAANYADGLLVFGSYDNHLYAVAAADGKLVWSIETGGYINGTPAIVDGTVISVGCDGVLRLIALKDGVLLGSIEIGAYVAASPAIREGVAYFGTYENQVLAVTLAGERRWAYEHPKRKFPFYSSAAVTDELLVVGGRDKMVHGIDPATGAALWTHSSGARVDSSPVIVGDRVFVGGSSGDLVALDAQSGAVVWQFETGSSIVASPSLASGRLVIGRRTATSTASVEINGPGRAARSRLFSRVSPRARNVTDAARNDRRRQRLRIQLSAVLTMDGRPVAEVPTGARYSGGR